MSMIENLETLLKNGQDNALIRFGLGNAYFQEGKYDEAATHLKKAVAFDPKYSAAWKLYGRALAEAGDVSGAINIFKKGIGIANKQGDNQAGKEMQVFLKRLEKEVKK